MIMFLGDGKDKLRVSRQNISFYDRIASSYNEIHAKDENNAAIRARVAEVFSSLVNRGSVVDFGGGTGEDLDWLLNNSHKIYFCEPSEGMRSIAQQKINKQSKSAPVAFLENEATDFRNWTNDFPFFEKQDAVLANFAVFNCIPDIERLFQKLALVLRPGGIVLAVILQNDFSKRLRSDWRALISGRPTTFTVDYQEMQQTVYVHSMKAIKSAASPYFLFEPGPQLQAAGFRLLHLVRK